MRATTKQMNIYRDTYIIPTYEYALPAIFYQKLHGPGGLLLQPDLKTMVGLDKGRITGGRAHITGNATTTTITFVGSTHE